MQWKITYYNNLVEETVLSLPDTLLARYIRLTEMMQVHGPNLGMPHTRAMGGGLYELRLKGKEGIARIFYCTVIRHEILILHSFIKKTEKIPRQELEIAKKHMKGVK